MSLEEEISKEEIIAIAGAISYYLEGKEFKIVGINRNESQTNYWKLSRVLGWGHYWRRKSWKY